MADSNTHLWVRTDLVRAIERNNGNLPKTWKPQKRYRDDAEWGWCRAIVVSSGTPAESPVGSPFGAVKLRKITNSPVVDKSQSSWRGSPSRFDKTVKITLTVDDPGAPLDVQNRTVSFTYNTGDLSKVCVANDWWYLNNAPPEDLTALEQLHEPAVVSCLEERYRQNHIYTYTGKILLALNPFRSIDSLYGENVMQTYCGNKNSVDRPPPHAYAIAQDAYRQMIRSMQVNSSANQSILVSGESGAGKTVTTKIIMKYLATLSQRSSTGDEGIEAQVLESNPILESFGNARTIRNDNSSRFGKFIDIQFGPRGALESASIQTYLLEKVRLISQAPGERNYHIFYELLAGLPQRDRKELCIANASIKDFRMTAVSGTFDRRDGVDDRETFRGLRHAMDTVGFSKEDQSNLFSVACAILHTSNLTFLESGHDGSEIDRSNLSLKSVVKLLGVDIEALNKALTSCEIKARHETVYKNLSVRQAEKAVEALIKVTYSALFSFIVRRINDFINLQQNSSSSSKAHASIGVLDIFGFESFEVNSFEQLCINFCNEALQQQFNRFVFELEQQEYEREGIEWSFISFPDNQDVLDLIEKKNDGILSILDEQSRLQRCTDKSFALTVYEKCSDHPRFEATNSHRADLCFGIHHYAGLVEYDTLNFIEKNNDELPKEATDLLLESSIPFVNLLGEILNEKVSKVEEPISKRATPSRHLMRSKSSILREGVGIQFANQLRHLREKIQKTEPHYIRCLKPNDDLIPGSFRHLVIEDQLRCAGVLEAIRVSRIGFPHRYRHDHFVKRYEILARTALKKVHRSGGSPQDLCECLVDVVAVQLADLVGSDDSELMSPGAKSSTKRHLSLGVQVGKTKVFLRRKAFEAFEHLRSNKIEDAVVRVQSFVRMVNAKVYLETAIDAALAIQLFYRDLNRYRMNKQLRIENSIVRIQCAWRSFVARRSRWSVLYIATWCQSSYRGMIARQYCAYLFLNRRASSIQRAWRSYKSSFYFRKFRRAVIRAQTLFRTFEAKKQLYALRAEAKDLMKVAAERDKLREESKQLKQELMRAKTIPAMSRKEKDKELKRLRSQIERLQMELEKARGQKDAPKYEAEVNALLRECREKESQLDALKNELADLKAREDLSSVLSVTSDAVLSLGSNTSRSLHSQSNRSLRHDISLLDAAEGFQQDPPPIIPSTVSEGIEMNPFTEISGNDPNSAHDDLLQRLHSAVREGDEKTFDECIRCSKNLTMLVNEGDKFGRTSLHIAVLSLRLDLAEKLLKSGAVVNVQDEDGETPLHLSESFKMMNLLLTKGNSNPNIPNVDGICALHLAVQRRDVDSVRLLLRNNANVNAADNIRWFTPLHLIALAARNPSEVPENERRTRIAALLCGSGGSKADVNFQDSEGNTPLHYACQLVNSDALDLVNIFLEHGADPNILNDRKQSPLHLLCHNEKLRLSDVYQETLHALLFQGADPNKQSMTGCTPLHLSLYHRDIESAIQLVQRGAELHLVWQKPKRWESFWDDRGSSDVLALDMVEDSHSLHRILSAITHSQKWAPARSWCMNCKAILGTFTRAMHCRGCSRLICDKCSSSCLPPEDFPKSFHVTEAAWVCTVCEKILQSRKDEVSQTTQPTSSYGEEELAFETSFEERYEC